MDCQRQTKTNIFNQVVEEEEVLLLQICEGNKLKANEPHLMETVVVTTWLFHFLTSVCLSVSSWVLLISTFPSLLVQARLSAAASWRAMTPKTLGKTTLF